ncbi:glycosyltransferase family 2 protein [Planktomarina temperata]|nr:glycosyltransferase family 2 protein [Planktomarina temperata]
MKKNHADSSVLFVGVARNCEDFIEPTISKVEDCFAGFSAKEWLIVESDSTDKTLSVLEKLKSDFIINVIAMGNLADQYYLRTERLALCRNRYLSEITSNPRYNNYDYVVVLDMDGVNIDLTREAIETCWGLEVEWDACFANQLAPYYDIWALRHEYWMPHDVFQEIRFLEWLGLSTKKANKNALFNRMVTIDKNHPVIKVSSAFGGFGLYKKELLHNGRYCGVNARGEEVCEHVAFHEDLNSKGANLYIVPSLINGSWNEHSVQSTSLNRYVSMVAQKIAKIFSS